MSHHHRDHATPTRPAAGRMTLAASPSAANGNKTKTISDEEIRLCAYQKWERAGRPVGDGVKFWLEAKQELAHAK
jgi:hypothetical protein